MLALLPSPHSVCLSSMEIVWLNVAVFRSYESDVPGCAPCGSTMAGYDYYVYVYSVDGICAVLYHFMRMLNGIPVMF